MNFFVPTVPRNWYPPAPLICRSTSYIVPWLSRGLLHFHPSSIQPMPSSCAVNPVGVPGLSVGDGLLGGGIIALGYTALPALAALARIWSMRVAPIVDSLSIADRNPCVADRAALCA